MPPFPRPSGSVSYPPARASAAQNSIPVFDIVKTRILIKLQERLDVSRSRRMPAALLAETARQQLEQLIEVEAVRLSRSDRDRLLDEVFSEAFGYGPLDELFADPAVKEITVLGPHAVIARRDQGWLPTNVKFRDDEHVHEVLEKVKAQGEPVGGGLPASALDVKLPNGFRVVAVIPPPALNLPPTAAFVRTPDAPAPSSAYTPAGTGSHAALNLGGSGSHAALNLSGSAAHTPPHTPPPGGSGRVAVPGPRSSATRSPAPGEYVLERHRVRIVERLIAKLASLGVYDLSRVDTNELRKVIGAYVTEYCTQEKIYLTDTDQGRLTLEILTTMKR